MNKIIDGKQASLLIKEELKQFTNTLDKKPGLAVIQVGNNPASTTYVRNKKKAAEYIGINFNHYHFEESTTEELIELINNLNKQDDIDGIIVQLPLPTEIDQNKVINTISEDKDVDGLTIRNIGKLLCGEEGLTPCTPTGIIKLLEMNNVEIEGKNAVVIGRSLLVGKPIANMLLNKNATVTICHTKTKNLKEITSQADILIVACGTSKLIKKDMVKDGAIVIDVGINKNNQGALCGDVDFDDVIEKASLITPVPGGVGPMTVAMLNYNVIKSYKKRRYK